jgi:hypothetical protein
VVNGNAFIRADACSGFLTVKGNLNVLAVTRVSFTPPLPPPFTYVSLLVHLMYNKLVSKVNINCHASDVSATAFSNTALHWTPRFSSEGTSKTGT